MALPIILIFLLSASASCKKYQVTRDNLRETDRVLVEAELETQPSSQQKPPRGSKVSHLPKNPWYVEVVQWSKNFQEMAEKEKDIRGFHKSELLSAQSLKWAGRALEIKELNTGEALKKIQAWLDGIELPPLPDKPNYFMGQDAFEGIALVRQKLDSVPNRLCAVSGRMPFMRSLVLLEYATLKLKSKNYSKSLRLSGQANSRIAKLDAKNIKCPDIDRDGIKTPLDLCPMEAEDRDGFEDKDGCPEWDNDQDSIVDAKDLCPGLPESINQYKDGDGCPDAIMVLNGIFAPGSPKVANFPKFISALKNFQKISQRLRTKVLVAGDKKDGSPEDLKLEITRLQDLRKKMFEYRRKQKNYGLNPLFVRVTGLLPRQKEGLPSGQIVIFASQK